MCRKKNLYINIILLVPWVHSTVLGKNFYPWLAGVYLKTLSSPTKNAIQVASKILRSILHMHSPNTTLHSRSLPLKSVVVIEIKESLEMKTALSDKTVFKAEADMCADQIMDLRNGWVRLCYNPNFVSSNNFCQRKKNIKSSISPFHLYLTYLSAVGHQLHLKGLTLYL